jgi:tetratricopeptide (TPR) repeat protein
VLQAMAPRLAEPAHQLLGVPADAPPSELRAAFLRLTKQFHPTKFARFAPDVVRLANEVFLTIKRAYDQLAASSAVPRPGRVAVGTGARQIRAGGTGAPPLRAATTPGPAAAPPRPAPTAPPPRAATVPGPAPVPSRPSGGIPRVTSAPPAGPDAEWEAAVDLLRRKLWGDARQAFQKLAVAAPHDRRYRAHMHYARAKEAQDAGRVDEARAELQRALTLDPELQRAKIALGELPEPDPGGGLFRKIFKR